MSKLSTLTALVGNELWNLGGNFQFDFTVQPNTVAEVLQNIYEIWSVPLGSQVFLRQFGNDVSWIDAPGDISQMQMQVAFLLACAKWEPRARFTTIQFTFDTNAVISGSYSLYVELTIDLTAKITQSLFGTPEPANVWVVDNKMDGSTYPIVANESLTL